MLNVMVYIKYARLSSHLPHIRAIKYLDLPSQNKGQYQNRIVVHYLFQICDLSRLCTVFIVINHIVGTNV